MKGGEKMRININMNEELVKKIDEAAKQLHISRSAYISISVSLKMQQDKAFAQMPELINLVEEKNLFE